MSWGFYVLSNKESAGFPQAVCSVESNTTHPSVVGASSQSASIQIILSVLERKYVERKHMWCNGVLDKPDKPAVCHVNQRTKHKKTE